MKFWSNLENEYNEILGGTEKSEDTPKESEDGDDKPDGDASFHNMLSDFKSDLKTIPKGEVFPAFPSGKKKGGKSDLVEESEFDLSDAKRAVKSADLKKKRDKRCQVGSKTYEIGERWQDEKSGKEMICILMNIPKEVQPSLAEADVTMTVPADDAEWSRPSVEPQWSYTANPKRKSAPDDSKNKADDDGMKSGNDEQKTGKVESGKDAENNDVERVGPLDNKEVEETVKSKRPKKPGKDKVPVKDPVEKKEKKASNKKVRKEKNTNEDGPQEKTKTAIGSGAVDDSVDTTGSKQKIVMEKEPKPISQITGQKGYPDSARETSSNDEVEPNRSQPQSNQRGKKVNKDRISDHEKALNAENKELKELKETESENNLKMDGKTNDNSGENSSQDLNRPEEVKGEPIFMKETVVKRRKLMRTEETIQTTTTDKTKSSQ